MVRSLLTFVTLYMYWFHTGRAGAQGWMPPITHSSPPTQPRPELTFPHVTISAAPSPFTSATTGYSFQVPADIVMV